MISTTRENVASDYEDDAISEEILSEPVSPIPIPISHSTSSSSGIQKLDVDSVLTSTTTTTMNAADNTQKLLQNENVDESSSSRLSSGKSSPRSIQESLSTLRKARSKKRNSSNGANATATPNSPKLTKEAHQHASHTMQQIDKKQTDVHNSNSDSSTRIDQLGQELRLANKELEESKRTIALLGAEIVALKAHSKDISFRDVVANGGQLRSTILNNEDVEKLQREMKQMDEIIKSLNLDNERLTAQLKAIDQTYAHRADVLVQEKQSIKLELEQLKEGFIKDSPTKTNSSFHFMRSPIHRDSNSNSKTMESTIKQQLEEIDHLKRELDNRDDEMSRRLEKLYKEHESIRTMYEKRVVSLETALNRKNSITQSASGIINTTSIRAPGSSTRLFDGLKKPSTPVIETKSALRDRTNSTSQKITDRKFEKESSKADAKLISPNIKSSKITSAAEIVSDKEVPTSSQVDQYNNAPISEKPNNAVPEILARPSSPTARPGSPTKQLRGSSPHSPRSPSPSKHVSAKIHAQLEQEISKLHLKYNNAISELHSVRAQLAVANDRVGRLSQERNQNAEVIQKLSNELNEITERYHKVQRQLDRAQSSRLYQEMMSLEARVEQLSERMLERERAFVVASQQQNWLAQSERVEFEAKLNALRMQKKEEIDALNIEIEQLMQSIAAQQNFSIPIRSKLSPTRNILNT